MLAVVSHDAGGAEILSSFVRQHPGDYQFALAGPALGIFERKLGAVRSVGLDAAIEESDKVLCGSSWQSCLECDAIALAKALGRRSVVFLDHWVNYRERLTRDRQLYLPDEIRVGDGEAKRLAVAAFPGVSVILEPNPFFADLKREFAARIQQEDRSAPESTVLYCTEPVREHARLQHGDERHFGYTEEEALRFFLTNVRTVVPGVRLIVIRPHPAEATGKYEWVRRETDVDVVTGGTRSLVEEIADADVVAGGQTMAMVVGLLGGKRVISSIPPGGPTCALPQRGIVHLRDLIRARHGTFSEEHGGRSGDVQ